MRYVQLGTGDALGAGTGGKAGLLDGAAGLGLPVPPGVVLLDATWQAARRDGLVAEDNAGRVHVPDPARLAAWLGLPLAYLAPAPGDRVAVRSAFSAEDRPGESLAGFFASRLHVDPRDPEALAAALADVWGSAHRYDGAAGAPVRRDVLVQRMVEAEHAGVAFTERAHEDDRANVAAGTADRLVAGTEPGTARTLAKLRPWETAHDADDGPAPLPPYARRLQRLLRDVRATLGRADWDVEWADDGRACHLVQVRPVTRPTTRNEAFTLANHKEILPALPSRFMATLIAACAGGLFDYYRQYDDELPTGRPFIEVFRGRPYINLSLLSEMMRIWGLPTRLVTDAIGGATTREAGLNVGRVLRKLPVLARLGLDQLRAPALARQAVGAILDEAPGATVAAHVAALRRVYVRLVTAMFALTAALGGPLALLRRAGTLAEHNARHQTLATRLYANLDGLRALAAARPAWHAALRAGRVPDDPAFRAPWHAFLDRHGHRGVYESDIARPRFREAPEGLLRSLTAPPRRAERPPRTTAGRLTRPVWVQAGRAMRAREALRYHAMRAFARLRRALLARADEAVARGALPARDALWMLSIDEAVRLDDGWAPDDAFWTARAAEQEALAAYRMPDLLHRFDDVERYRADARASDAHDAPRPARLRGLPLTPGTVTGHAWVLAEPATTLPDGFTPADTILVARSVDAGWMPTFALVAGVVVETGGDLSHGSIILREIGLPAMTNVHGAARAVRTGDRLHLRAGEGTAAVTQADGRPAPRA